MVTHTHTYIHTYIHIHTHNRNIWPSATPTANQYKHMAEGHTIETYGHTIARRRRRRHAWPILLSFNAPSTHYLHIFAYVTSSSTQRHTQMHVPLGQCVKIDLDEKILFMTYTCIVLFSRGILDIQIQLV